ncbi:HAD-IIIC family phosphatase [Priestia aryabhattai]|uniref:HAD-IIIC family phosphatase n=1 Tax=Priestia aryabhattai TaxID=412384 RepID=UPI001874CFB8|nr:HAD-IIIC family phosphatase [Priestia aryabhattai]MBE5102253.1 HAD family hydrolase [Priestia aryabhattai]
MNDKELLKQIKNIVKEESNFDIPPSIIESLQQIDSVLTKEKIGHLFRKFNFHDTPSFQELKVGVLSNFNVDEITTYIRFESLKNNIFPNFYLSSFNQYVYELINKDSQLYQSSPDITICLLDEEFIFDEVSSIIDIKEVEETIKRKLFELESLIQTFMQHNNGLFILNTIPLNKLTHQTIIDYRTKAALSRVWRQFNGQLLSLMDHYEQLIVVDIDLLYQDSTVFLRNDKMNYYGSMSFSQELLSSIAEEINKISRSILGLQKKCLVLDLDNTLWGGVIGDAGLQGIKLGPDSKVGNVYFNFQKMIRNLGNQGVLLTINSKNEWTNVQEVFDKHPYTILKEEDFVKICANWEPKHENIKIIQSELNIGMNSLVFIDDSSFEREMVNTYLPEVEVSQMPEDPSYYMFEVLRKGWFNTISLTKEDHTRKEKYKQIVKRETLKKSSHSIEEYLYALDIKVDIVNPSDFTIPRLAQLTQRTNQFNMTTQRLKETELKVMIDDPKMIVFGFRATDKFGDNGIVGAVCIEEHNNSNNKIWNIQNFIMSCRVFSRGIETAVLNHVITKAKEAQVKKIVGFYIPSKKNHIVENFYIEHGFKASNEQSNKFSFEYELDSTLTKQAPWINLNAKEEVVR